MPEPEKSDHARAVDEMMDQSAKRPASPPPPVDRMLQFFEYEHLPEHLRAVSAPFGVLAMRIVENLPSNPERTVALRKLLEAKDCAVRAVLYKG